MYHQVLTPDFYTWFSSDSLTFQKLFNWTNQTITLFASMKTYHYLRNDTTPFPLGVVHNILWSVTWKSFNKGCWLIDTNYRRTPWSDRAIWFWTWVSVLSALLFKLCQSPSVDRHRDVDVDLPVALSRVGRFSRYIYKIIFQIKFI